MYLKSHAVDMMFKDAIVLKKEKLDDDTKIKGINTLKYMMESALQTMLTTNNF